MYHKVKVITPKNLGFIVPKSSDRELGKVRKRRTSDNMNTPNKTDQGSGRATKQAGTQGEKSPPLIQMTGSSEIDFMFKLISCSNSSLT